MVFSAAPFLAWFLPLTLLTHALSRGRIRNVFLLALSLVFYAVGSGNFVAMLAATTVVDYAIGRAFGRRGEGERTERDRLLIGLSLAMNLSVLGWFKYANFVVEQVTTVRAFSGLDALPWTTVLLPIGISFFTFQRMSYVIDVYRGVHPPERSLVRFLLYVSLFPQLIAGPIVRYDDIRTELTDRRVTSLDVSAGASRFVVGLAKKIIVADSVAVVADAVFATGEGLTTAEAWIGAIAYTIQIYFDFSGYSDMAIGLGRMLGFKFPENFARPYSAQSMTDFWRRWHITLSSWFRDYVYLPLGGSRKPLPRVLVNLSIVFLLTGLWHGSAWTFVLWGAYHGAILVAERLTGQRALDAVGLRAVTGRVITLLAVIVGWVLFRAESLSLATEMIATMFTPRGLGLRVAVTDVLTNRVTITILLGSLTALLPATAAAARHLDRPAAGMGRIRLGVVALGLPVCFLLASSATFSPFLYFRF